MFCEESLGKIKFRAFSEQVCSRILSLERVDYFGKRENYRSRKKKRRTLYHIKQNCVGLVMSMRFIFSDD